MFKKYSLIIVCFIIIFKINAQTAFVNVSNKNIYDFLDEIANDKIINLNSTVKPYSRKYILTKLEEAYENKEELSIRQLEEFEFYLKEYNFDRGSTVNPISGKAKLNIFKKYPAFATSINPFGVFYKDSLFTLSVRPIWGTKFYLNSNDTIRHTWGGAEAYAYIGKHFGMYASLRDNQVSKMLNYILNRLKIGSH